MDGEVHPLTKKENIYYNRLDEPHRVTLKENDRDFSLKGHDGQFVSWFGIVREIMTDKEGLITSRLVENKYSHDLSDAHIQTVSINGAGDFRVELATHSKDILPLILVRVYGEVVGATDQELKRIKQFDIDTQKTKSKGQ